MCMCCGCELSINCRVPIIASFFVSVSVSVSVSVRVCGCVCGVVCVWESEHYRVAKTHRIS